MEMDKTLIELVKKEAENLRNNSTEEERAKLNISMLDPDERKHCIYGQMTGSCFSHRSHRLITECCERVYHALPERLITSCNIFESSQLNGKPKISKYGDRASHWFSPIEAFITIPHNQETRNNEILIDYIKGNTDTIEFE